MFASGLPPPPTLGNAVEVLPNLRPPKGDYYTAFFLFDRATFQRERLSKESVRTVGPFKYERGVSEGRGSEA